MISELRAEVSASPPIAKKLAIALAACVIVLSALGTWHALYAKLEPFEVSGEIQEGVAFFPLVSAGLLLATALLAARFALAPGERSLRLAWLGLAGLFVFMASDELGQIHEQVEDAVGFTWQILYLPLLAIGGISWLWVLRELWPRLLERALWIAGAAAWFVARVIDNVPYSLAKADSFDLADVAAGIEEVLEISGNACWLLALVLVATRLTQARAAATA